MNGASGRAARVLSSMLSVPTALTSKSVNGSLAAQSWLGWPAVWITTAMSGPYRLKILAEAVAVADVDVEVRVGVAELAGQPQQAPRGRAVRAEEVAAHVVVDADDVAGRGAAKCRTASDPIRPAEPVTNATLTLRPPACHVARPDMHSGLGPDRSLPGPNRGPRGRAGTWL